MQDLNIAIIQTYLFWEEPARNLEHFNRLLCEVNSSRDLILLPEMFNTGFSINPQCCSETMDGPSVQFLQDTAIKKNAVVMATVMIRDPVGFYNRLICMYPDGRYKTYDKRHLFRLSEEYKLFYQGKDHLIVDVKGWKIMPQICYDLRFPVWSKNTYQDQQYAYDVLIYLANWPNSRANVWKTLLTARAMENQVFVVGVNRIGDDAQGAYHSGDSMVIDAKGNPIAKANEGKEQILNTTLSATDLKLFRESFTLGMDWDQFRIIV